MPSRGNGKITVFHDEEDYAAFAALLGLESALGPPPAAVHYNTRIVYTLMILAHKKYDRNAWKEQL